jgi:hypothetical protein
LGCRLDGHPVERVPGFQFRSSHEEDRDTAYRANFRNQETIRFSADETGVLHEGDSYRTNTVWEQITQVELSQGFYLLYVGPGRAQPVPATSFSVKDRQRFESLLDRHKPGWRK